jgi:UDP-N-acetylmuramoyl-L-alanyl-D-glutamate--2,6-diaminopimelate ligase
MPPGFLPFPPPPAWAHALSSVGVTGTNGKTTTTRWTAAALATLGSPVLSITTVGVFLDDEPWGTLRSHDEFLALANRARHLGVRFLCIETTSEALGLGFARAWPFTVGVFTNLSRDHLDAHRTVEHYLASKAQLFVHLPESGAAVLNAADSATPLLREVIPNGVSVLPYHASEAEPHCVTSSDVAISWSGTTCRLHVDREDWINLSLPAIGEVYVANALAALSAAHFLGVPWTRGADALRHAKPIPGRFQLVHREPFVVIDYAHTPDALEQAIHTARSLCEGCLTVVFGAGGDRDRGKRPAMGQAARLADRVILTSDNPRGESPSDIAQQIARGLSEHANVHFEMDRNEAIGMAVSTAHSKDVILVAGKGHEAFQTVGDTAIPMKDEDIVCRWLGVGSRCNNPVP